MNLDIAEPVDIAVKLSWALLLVGMALALFRIVRGPRTADRVVAFDLVAYFAVALCALHALGEHAEYPLHPAMALALLAFLGTIVFIVFARQLRQRKD